MGEWGRGGGGYIPNFSISTQMNNGQRESMRINLNLRNAEKSITRENWNQKKRGDAASSDRINGFCCFCADNARRRRLPPLLLLLDSILSTRHPIDFRNLPGRPGSSYLIRRLARLGSSSSDH